MAPLRALLCLVGLMGLVLASRALAGGVAAAAGDEAALGLGCALIGAYVGGELAALVSLPRLTGYLLVGLLLGPDVGRWLAEDPPFLTDPALTTLALLDDVSIGIIAFLGGGELRWREVRAGLRGFLGLLAGHLLGAGVAVAVLVGLWPRGVGLGALTPAAAWAAAILLGVVAATASPATVLAVRTEVRARGPLADASLAVVVLIDVAIALLLTLAVAAARSLVGGAAGGPGLGLVLWEVVGSLGAGVLVGGFLVLLLSRVRDELPAVLLACAIGTMFLAARLHLSGLLVCMVAGFVVENCSRHGEALVATLERSSLPLFAVFFAVAGARIDLGLIGATGAGLLLLVLVRTAGSVAGTVALGHLAGATPTATRWAWTGLAGQAGLSLALAATIVKAFPEMGESLRTLILASVAANQVVGPIAFRVALARCGEVGGVASAPAPP